jgi:hypothetical protein
MRSKNTENIGIKVLASGLFHEVPNIGGLTHAAKSGEND